MVSFLNAHQTLLFLILMLAGTFSLSLSDIEIKKLLNKNVDEQAVLGLTFFLAGLGLFTPFIFLTFPEIKSGFWITVTGTVILNIISQRIFFKALKLGDVSLIAPLRLITPVLVILTGYVVLQEAPPAGGTVGIICTVIGLWILLCADKPFSLSGWKKIRNENGVLLGLLAAMLFALSFPLDKKAVVDSSALFATAIIFTSIGVITLFLNSLADRKFGLKLVAAGKENYRPILLTALWIAAGVLLTYQALNFSFAAYAASLRRLQALWTILLAGSFLKEKNIGTKIVSAGFILLGTFIMLIS